MCVVYVYLVGVIAFQNIYEYLECGCNKWLLFSGYPRPLWTSRSQRTCRRASEFMYFFEALTIAAFVGHIFSLVFTPCGLVMQNLAVAEFLRRYVINQYLIVYYNSELCSSYYAPYVPLHI